MWKKYIIFNPLSLDITPLDFFGYFKKEKIAGVLDKISDMTAFLNPTENSYKRFGSDKAPAYISWSSENRSQLVRIPAAVGEYRRAELRSPDPMATHQ